MKEQHSNNKKIFFLIPTLFRGGSERVVSELSLNFPKYIKSTIVLFENKVSYNYKGGLIDLRTKVTTNIFLRSYYFILQFCRFKKLIKKENPDYVISLGNVASAINIFTNKKSVVRVDLFLSKSTKGFWGLISRLFARVFFNRAWCIIAVSRMIEKDLIENFGVNKNRIKVIYNIVDVERIQKLAKEDIDNSYKDIFKNPVIITSGRLIHQKGHWHLIKAFLKVKKTFPSLKLVILGEGELRSDLEKLIANLRLKNDIFLLGWQKNPFSLLYNSKIFVLSSLHEGFPDVLLEALACGLPIISTDCKSGPREMLSPLTSINSETNNIEYGEYGILTPVGDGVFSSSLMLTKEENLLADSIIELYSNKELMDNLNIKAKERAQDFSPEKIIKDWNFL